MPARCDVICIRVIITQVHLPLFYAVSRNTHCCCCIYYSIIIPLISSYSSPCPSCRRIGGSYSSTSTRQTPYEHYQSILLRCCCCIYYSIMIPLVSSSSSYPCRSPVHHISLAAVAVPVAVVAAAVAAAVFQYTYRRQSDTTFSNSISISSSSSSSSILSSI